MNMSIIEFLHWLCSGFNPITGEKLDDQDILRNRDVMTRLFNLELELRECEDISHKEAIIKLNLLPEFLNEIHIVEPYTTATTFCENIADATGLNMRDTRTKLLNYLKTRGYLDYSSAQRQATPLGQSIGICNLPVVAKSGKKYFNVQYSSYAQKFLINILDQILD